MAKHGENIRKRKDGRWEARLLMKAANGTKKYKSFYGHSYEEAKEKRYRYSLSLIIPVNISANSNHYVKPILFKHLLEEWLYYVRSRVKASTYSKYCFNVHRHINTSLGEYPVHEISIILLDKFSSEKLSSGNIKNNTGLSPKTVNDLLSVIKMGLSFAIERGYLPPNNTIIHTIKNNTSKITVLSVKEQNCLEQYLHLNTTTCSLGILLSLFTGLRIGEVCGLKWGDISFASGLLYVKRTVTRIQNPDSDTAPKTRLIIDIPKTESSKREIPIPDFLLNLLQTYRQKDEYFLLSNSIRCKDPRNYYRQYKRILKNCNLEQYNYHALRHTFATRCVEYGFDIKSLSEILGHSNVSITLQRYVHPSLEIKREQMNRLERLSISGQIHRKLDVK